MCVCVCVCVLKKKLELLFVLSIFRSLHVSRHFRLILCDIFTSFYDVAETQSFFTRCTFVFSPPSVRSGLFFFIFIFFYFYFFFFFLIIIFNFFYYFFFFSPFFFLLFFCPLNFCDQSHYHKTFLFNLCTF